MLTIYSASAGTGKTHALAGEYLKLLFKGKEEYRRILAVTFTNKATAEMKRRIIEELFNLADNQPSDYISELSGNGKKDEAAIRSQAKQILIAILHDYSAFNISTIDHFFQRTIRAFTREIGLQGNYRIELDASRMMEESVEDMLAGLDGTSNKDLLDWLLRFTEDKIEDAGGWDIRGDIKKLGGQLFKESFKAYGEEAKKAIGRKNFLADYLGGLRKIIQSTHETAKALGENGLSLMRKLGMQPSDFFGASKSPFFFFERLAKGEMKEPSATFIGLADNLDGYLSKSASAEQRQAAERIFYGGMNDAVKGTAAFFGNLADYHTAAEIARNFYALGILTDLSQHIAQWREENNKLFIADTTELLNKVINSSEVPFIYEKTGTRIEHYMIDEFQDTSAMQWANFRPLLKDSLDSGRSNLIVGDVKQSIYRFRNSDWTLLDTRVKKDFPHQINEKKLDTNWRSCLNIVECNNMLFDAMPMLLQRSYNEGLEQSPLADEEKERFGARIVSAYKDSRQQVAKPFMDKGGHVRISFLDDNDGKDWKEQSMEQLPHTIEQLQDNGYELHDIAILARDGKECLAAAETLLEYKASHNGSKYKYDIISEDSLMISSASSVRWMAAMLKYLNRPDMAGIYEMAQVAYAAMRKKKSHGANEAIGGFFRPFPPETAAALRLLSKCPLYELAEGVFRLFESDLPDDEIVFVQAFLDAILEFSANEIADTDKFLEWWDETGREKKIATPDSQNAIRIMTIHKSKGLGFKAVIIPFADWKFDQKETIIWCRPEREPFDKLKIVPVKYGKTLEKTIFAKDYFHEKLHAYIDNLNTLYVAFTRAKEELVVTAPRPKTPAPRVSKLLWDSLQAGGGYQLDAETGVYERGEWQRAAAKKTSGEIEELPIQRFYSLSPGQRMQLRLRGRNSLFNDEKRKYGILVHDILSGIEKGSDIGRSVSAKLSSGEINETEAETLKRKLESLVADESVKNWFDGSTKVMAEAEILFGNGQSRRPDRIMIGRDGNVAVVDYKSGEKKEKAHLRQVEKYMSLIREMGYRDVSGFVWYIALGEIEKVQAPS